jgi:hypothetical protein
MGGHGSKQCKFTCSSKFGRERHWWHADAVAQLSWKPLETAVKKNANSRWKTGMHSKLSEETRFLNVQLKNASRAKDRA